MSELRCIKCNRVLNEQTETVWNKVTGWEKKRAGGGTNHLALRQPQDDVMCNGCMNLMLAGLDPGQTRLL